MDRFPPDDAGRCRTCAGPGQADCPLEVDSDALRGFRLAVAAVGLFLVPLLLACGGALWFQASPAGQLGGACAGLLIGMGGSLGWAWIRHYQR
jgi:hypothetical protein